MEEIKKRISYVKGLADGYNISAETKEGRIISELINVLGDMAEDIEELMFSQAELEDYVETLDEDLGDLEEDVYELDEEYETYDDESEYYDDTVLGDDGNYVEMECPNCQEEVFFDSGILKDEDVVEVVCPNCDEVLFVNDQEETIVNRRVHHRSSTPDI